MTADPTGLVAMPIDCEDLTKVRPKGFSAVTFRKGPRAGSMNSSPTATLASATQKTDDQGLNWDHRNGQMEDGILINAGVKVIACRRLSLHDTNWLRGFS